jgi:hypothetical protein
MGVDAIGTLECLYGVGNIVLDVDVNTLKNCQALRYSRPEVLQRDRCQHGGTCLCGHVGNAEPIDVPAAPLRENTQQVGFAARAGPQRHQ